MDIEDKSEKLVINWFPGHMHKTRKLIRANISRVNMVIEMRDARIPGSSCNPLLKEIIGDKPVLILLNKADMADAKVTEKWILSLKKERQSALAVDSTDPRLKRKIVTACKQLLPDFDNSARTNIKAMIIGIPNVGKSTLLNTVSTSSKAKTGNRPAVTKLLQNVRIPGGVDLLDTPGVLWPKIESEGQGVRLVSVGSIKDSVVDIYRITARLAQILIDDYPDLVATRFKIKEMPTSGYEMIEMVGRKRGCLLAGGKIDLDRAAAIFLVEYRDGKIGRMSLESPDV